MFIDTAKDVATHLAKTGKLIASPAMTTARRKICFNCEFRSNDRCGKCGCFISTKTSLEAAKCPTGRW